MKYTILICLLLIMSCKNKAKLDSTSIPSEQTENLIAVLDTIWNDEQIPIRLRDSLIEIYGTESELVKDAVTVDDQVLELNGSSTVVCLKTFAGGNNEKIKRRIKHNENYLKKKKFRKRQMQAPA